MRFVVLDFETASDCELKLAGAWRYSEDPTTEILCLCWKFLGQPWKSWVPGESGDELRAVIASEGVMFIAHNAAFEKSIWRNIMMPDFDWPDIENTRWIDTMASCAMKVLPMALEDAALALRLPVQKDMEGRALVRSLSKPIKGKKNPLAGTYDRSPETIARVIRYCGTDCEAEEALFNRVKFIPPGERKVWLLDQTINERGVRLDMDFVRQAQTIVNKAMEPLEEEFRELTGGLRFTQVDKVGKWLHDRKVFLPNLQKETLVEWIGDVDGEDDDPGALINIDPVAHRALSVRQLAGSASVKKLLSMDRCVAMDGRVRYSLQYHGAGPGRWAGRLFQPHNFPRGSLKDMNDAYDKDVEGRIDALVGAIMSGDPDYLSMVTGRPPIESVLSGLRHAIIAEPGHLLEVGDFATIEARVVLAMAGQMDKVALLEARHDIYIDMAKQIYGRPIDKKKDPEERQTGKNSVLGLGFQMAAPKFRDRYAKEHPIEFAENVVRIYRKEWAPEVPKMWYGLEEAAVRTVWDRTPHEAYGVEYRLEDGWMTARLPSGRKLWYFNPRPVKKAMPWDDTDIRPAWTYNAMKVGRWATIDAYGGLLTENVVQATARDLLVHAALKAEAEGRPLVLTVHDELVAEVEDWKADPLAIEEIMCDRPAWAKALNIPVAAETWTGERYRK